MTELNQNALPEAAPDVAWPELLLSEAEEAAVPDSDPSGSAASDSAVQAVLRRVRDVPGLPVSEHPAAYTDMHDAVLELLNEDTSSGSGAA
ncbi:hypothetical protein [Arthrobacter sp. ISL-5]|uniref:hypothetical protein n=1 Tax=Arthrobacter sp. ISL-5 TaxID=2819111 RepID=UPI001BEC293E|nr:hypothetical protein [Arthrobacter sp. ISL-5]MBT2555676.1 hypothetical protein [Arthrobacter sp. ISL-5]